MSSTLWQPVVAKKQLFWARQFAAVPTRAQNTFDAIFGVIFPVFCFMADPVVFKGLITDRAELADYRLVAYVISTIEMGMFLVWRTFRKQVNSLSPIFAVAFLAGAMFSAAIGLAILPLTLIGLLFVIGIFGLVPFPTAFVYLRSGVRALRTLPKDFGGQATNRRGLTSESNFTGFDGV